MHSLLGKPGEMMRNLSRQVNRVRDYLVLRHLGNLPRYRMTTVHLLGRPLQVPDTASFVHQYREIFRCEIYRFASFRRDPYILDGGANIGLGAIYFRKIFPACRLTAFECDPHIAAVLQTNLNTFGHHDVRVVQRALWSSETELYFTSDGADSGRISDHRAGAQSVRTTRLRDYLTEPIDFLKLDIEGAESEVLEDCKDSLGCVRNLFVEYHSFAGRKQTLARILGILDAAGFRLHIHDQLVSPQPFMHREVSLDMDHRLNIFALRE